MLETECKRSFLSGNEALCEGALYAGCNFYAGYPITPASEIIEILSKRMPALGRVSMQLEDEISSLAAVIGASLAGAKAMTATSGPGVSLMLENLGLAVMCEIPLVLVNIMRGGPSTGLPTKPAQGDVMQARYGSHGDYEIVAMIPNSVQESFDLIIEAFNISEMLRVPVIFLSSADVAHMRETVFIPEENDIIPVINRKTPSRVTTDFKPFNNNAPDLVPPMPIFGEGYNTHYTGLTHNEYGFPSDDPVVHTKLIERLKKKITNKLDEITKIDARFLEDAELIVISYGSPSRAALKAVMDARTAGLKVGYIRLITLWPFPLDMLKKLAENANKLLVLELNMGQIVNQVRLLGNKTIHFFPKIGGTLFMPEEILLEIRRCLKK
ncbi:MAG: 2-oxoacid:acceptor oxidoreductase subunit alpha [Promethearchaeota archaeon]